MISVEERIPPRKYTPYEEPRQSDLTMSSISTGTISSVPYAYTTVAASAVKAAVVGVAGANLSF